MNNIGVDDLVEPDCSHPPEAANTENGFGVSVDLSYYFSDERAKVFVWAQRGRRVRWLQQRLQRRLRLLAPPALLTPLGLLLPQDPLALLRPHDTIRAIPAKIGWFNEETDYDNASHIEINTNKTNICIDQRAIHTDIQNENGNEVDHEICNEVENDEVETATHLNIGINETENKTMNIMVKKDTCDENKLDDNLEVMKNRAMALLESCFPLGVPSIDLQSVDDEEIEDETCQSELEPGERPTKRRKKKRTGKRRNRPNRIRPNRLNRSGTSVTMVTDDGTEKRTSGDGEGETAGIDVRDGGYSAELGDDSVDLGGGGLENSSAEHGGGVAGAVGGIVDHGDDSAGAVGSSVEHGGGGAGAGAGGGGPVLLNMAASAAAPRLVHALS